jgi:hypothetical protein
MVERNAEADGSSAFRIYDIATGDEDARLCRDITESQCRDQPENFVHQVSAQALTLKDVQAE